MACCTLLKCWTLMLVIIGIGEKVQLQKVVEQSAPLVVGATEQDALLMLGEPKMKWDSRRGVARFIFGERPAQWIYGTTIDLQLIIIPELPFPNPIPIKIRLFFADEDDLVIDWTPDNKVSAVKRPEIDIPDDLAKLYEPVYFFADLARTLIPTNTD